MNILGVYKNGNYNVTILSDGTKIRRTEEDEFIPEFPENADVKITDKLKNHPVCLTSNGAISTQMEKVINAMPNSEKVSSSLTLEINDSHPILAKLKDLYKDDEKQFEKYTKVLYAQSKLIEGLPIDNPTELSNLVCDLLSK